MTARLGWLSQNGQLLLGDNVTDNGGKISFTGSTGSANFSDVVNIGSWSSSDPAFSARLGGTNNFKFRANLSAPNSKIVDFHNNGSTDNEVVASISASGAGNFLGGVTVGGNGATQYKGSWISDGTLRIGGTLPASPNIELNASDGSARLVGDVQSTNYVSGPSGYRLSANNGFVAARNDSGSVEKIWTGLKGGTGSANQTSIIYITAAPSLWQY